MLRTLVVTALCACWALFPSVATAEDEQARPTYNPVALFKRLDANSDGEMSLDEFLQLTKISPKLKDKPDTAKLLFAQLNTNRDSFLSLEEFVKIVSIGQNQPPAAKAEPTKPIAAPPDMPATSEGIAFFEKHIRPVLVNKCYECHSENAEEIGGNFVLDTRAGIRRGGDLGPAVVPGNLKETVLLEAIRHQSDSLQMPPEEKLSDEIIANFEKWILMGAPDPRDGQARIVWHEIDLEKGREWWAFQPPKKSLLPEVKDTNWPRNDIDRFLLAALEAKGMSPAGDADRATLVRRVYFDLIGLPPTPEVVVSFLQDETPEAFATVVDKLLLSPRFGEHWGRHWLDVARYAESSGKQANMSYPHAWRYRDYVINSLHADKPFDQFIREQLAGDLLPAQNDQQKAELLVATGFLAIGSKNHNERLPQQFLLDLIDEQIDATTTAFLGMTVSCARCHDHKFDPISTKDYYALSGIFRSTTTCYGTIRTVQSNHPRPLVTLPKDSGASVSLPPMTDKLRKSLDSQIARYQGAQKRSGTGGQVSVAAAITRLQIENLQSRFALYEEDGTPKLLAMGVRDNYRPADSKLYIRGELDQPGETVKRGFPQVMTSSQPDIALGSGRLELANWIAAPENPLTARVMANRVWLHLFGRGIVASPDNFGSTGQLPSNPELLDHIALSFIDYGWSVKSLIRMLVLSRAYQQSSQFDAKNHEVDPDNNLVWRMSKRRLEAESLRDSMLAISGNLDPEAPTGSCITPNGEGTVLISFRTRQIDSYNNEHYRSVYLPIIRDMLPESLSLFDFPDPTLIAGERAVTTIPAQSLYLMNNSFVIEQSQTVAKKLLADYSSAEERLARAYMLFLSRRPTEGETTAAMEFLKNYETVIKPDKNLSRYPRLSSWSALCQSLFACTEFNHR